MTNIYSKALDAYIRRSGMTQQGFARVSGYSQTIVWQWLQGTRFPSKKAARQIDAATGGDLPFALWQSAAVERLGIYS